MLGRHVPRRLPYRCGHFQTAILHRCANAIVRQPNNESGFPQSVFPPRKPAYFLPPHVPPKPDDGAYSQPAGHTTPKQPYFLWPHCRACREESLRRYAPCLQPHNRQPRQLYPLQANPPYRAEFLPTKQAAVAERQTAGANLRRQPATANLA